MEAGDQNTKLFHRYASYRRLYNSISELQDPGSLPISGFKNMSNLAMEHFKGLYSNPGNQDMGGLLQVIGKFPCMLELEDNEELFQAVPSEELLAVLKTFKRDKSSSPNGWSPQFFVDFFDLVRKYLLKMVE